MAETLNNKQYAQYVAMCSRDAYLTARSACLLFGMAALESNIMAGLQTGGAAGLEPTERSLIAQDLLLRLYGKTLDELSEEQTQETEEENESLAKMFSDDQA